MAPLHQAVTEENLAAVQLLVKTGADINKQDEDSWTPLHAACANGFTDIVRYNINSLAKKFSQYSIFFLILLQNWSSDRGSSDRV